MDFSLNEETILLRSSARRYLKEHCPTSFVREMAKDEQGFSRAMWKEMAELGWLGLSYEETYGGTGGSLLDLAILMEEMGKALLPSPFFCCIVLAGLVINEAGNAQLKEDYLPQMIRGEKILTLASLDERGRYDHRVPKTEVRDHGDGLCVMNGTRILVPYAHVAEEILVCADYTDSKKHGPTIFRTLRESGQKILPAETLTGEKLSIVLYEDTKLSSTDVLGSPGQGSSYIEKILPKAVICKCAEMVGGLDRVVEMTVQYMKERVQFGRPLGALQAVQHYCADMATYLESSRLIAYQAASLLSECISCEKEIAIAKAWCSDAYKKCSWIAHQLHGGIGFTEEHDLHLYYQHAKASELMFGDSFFHRMEVARQMGY